MQEGNNIYLRPLVEDDFNDRYLTWFKDAEVTRFLEARNITREDAIKHLHDGEDGKNWRLYAICEKATERHIGNIKIGPIDWKNGVSDLVTVIGERDAWGKGYAREAIKRGMEIAFDELHIRKLSASIVSGNTGSIKAYTAAGFTVEATLKDQYKDAAGQMYDKVFVSAFAPLKQ
ncbi:MAG: GNAT family N-acetyltransferase [Patescibacteria group bacterium]